MEQRRRLVIEASVAKPWVQPRNEPLPPFHPIRSFAKAIQKSLVKENVYQNRVQRLGRVLVRTSLMDLA